MEGGVNEVWDDYADRPAVADLLLRLGFSPAEAGKLLGGNYIRVFRAVVGSTPEDPSPWPEDPSSIRRSPSSPIRTG